MSWSWAFSAPTYSGLGLLIPSRSWAISWERLMLPSFAWVSISGESSELIDDAESWEGDSSSPWSWSIVMMFEFTAPAFSAFASSAACSDSFWEGPSDAGTTIVVSFSWLRTWDLDWDFWEFFGTSSVVLTGEVSPDCYALTFLETSTSTFCL